MDIQVHVEYPLPLAKFGPLVGFGNCVPCLSLAASAVQH